VSEESWRGSVEGDQEKEGPGHDRGVVSTTVKDSAIGWKFASVRSGRLGYIPYCSTVFILDRT
jgi:hypothetical protein